MPSYVSILYVDALVEQDSKYHDCSFPPKCNHKGELLYALLCDVSEACC